ncbi:MAG: hypothetical protein AAF773_01710 [Cyanobacteria bacterium P01_D01_bin.115]
MPESDRKSAIDITAIASSNSVAPRPQLTVTAIHTIGKYWRLLV